jgi:RHS repeat-associated protein
MGSLIGGQRDPGGTMYMRNRYYDPQTGQFTQTDPIGIGGGMNTYGFAGGDPVGNRDPFGTCYFRIGPDYAFGRCGEDQQYYDSPQQERGPCARNSDGGCITYIPSVEQWNRLGNTFRRIPTNIDYCAGTRRILLDLWNMGRQSGRIKFWDGYDILILRGRRQQIRGDHAWDGLTGSWITYDSWLVFDEGSAAAHEGLHGYFHRVDPPPGITDLEAYIHDIDGNCSWK